MADVSALFCGGADGFWLTPDLFRLRRVTWKSTPSNQGCLLLVRFLLRRNTLTSATLRGPAAIRHPWRGAALAASMPLGPLHATCVQPAPKSRFVVSGRLRTKIKIKIDGDGDGVHRTCSSPACRRRRFHIRHRRPNGTLPGPTATRRGMHIRAMIVPTLRVECLSGRSASRLTRSVSRCVTTRSVGTIKQ
jgi:hypothetical protein